MAIIWKDSFDNIREHTATVGTGTVTLGGPVTGCRAFANGNLTDGQQFYYTLREGNNEETGQATYSILGTASRDVVYSSTLGGTTKISLAGTAQIWLDFGAAAITGLATAPGTGTVTDVSVVNTTGISSSVANPTTTPAITITLDATLVALSALSIAANSITIGTGTDTFSQLSLGTNTFPARASTGNILAKPFTDFAFSLVDDVDGQTARATLGLIIGTDVPAYSATLNALGGLTSGANLGIRFTGTGTAGTFDLAAFALTFLDDADADTVKTTLGVGLNFAGTNYGAIIDNGNSGTALTINFSLKNIQKVTLTGNVAFTLTPPTGTANIQLLLLGGAGGFTPTWPGTVLWATTAAIPPTSLAAAKRQWITGIWDGTNYHLQFTPAY